MDSDSSIDDISPIDFISAWNTRTTGTGEEEDSDVSNIEGTNLIPSTLNAGLNKCVGAAGFPTIRKGYAFIYNSQGLWQLKELDFDAQTETVIFTNKTDSGGISVFDLDPQFYITDIKLIQDKYLCFTDKYSQPHYLNLDRLKNGSYGVLTTEDFSLIKGQPIKQPIAVYNDDAGRSVNLLKNRLFQFREQWEKLDNELTAWSTISKRIVPTDEPTPAVGTNVTIANNLIVTVDAGNNRTKKINVAARYDLLDWFLIKSIDRTTVVALPNTTVDVSQQIYEAYDPATNLYSFAFYNDGLYNNISVLETDLPYDYVPNKVGSLEVINGSILALADLTEGYERPTLQASLTVTSYDPKIGFTTPPSNPLRITGAYDNGNAGGHKRNVTVGFAGTAKTGDKIFIQLRDLRDYSQTLTYTVTTTSGENLNTQAVINRLSTLIPASSTSAGTIYILTPPYYELSIARLELANAGTGASKSIHSLKTNSSYQLCLMGVDEDGKYYPIVTDERFVIKTPSYALTHGLIPQINWDIRGSVPPVGMVSYQWGISENNTHQRWLDINGAYDDTLSDADYLIFDIKSLNKFNTTNTSSILNYEYSEGDRATLYFTFSGTNVPIKWFDSPAIDIEVVGFEIVRDPTTTEITHQYLKIRKSSALNTADLLSVGTLMEIYSPKKRVITNTDGTTSEASTLFYEIGERFDVVNGQYSVLQGTITEGDSYFKTRNLTGVLDPNTPYVFQVEDPNFSDFYKSNYYSFGRPRIYDDEQGRVEKKASIRYSDTFITGSKVNGITRFYGERIYGEGAGETSSSYGAIGKIRMRDNYLICIQELKVGHIPVNMSIVEDQVEQRQYAISDKLLNFVRYLSGNYGIGTAKESYAESQNGTIYFADPNNSLPIRDGYDGLSVISGKMEKYFRRVLKQAKADGLKIIGYYDNFNNEYNLSIENKNGVLTYFSFNDSDWQFGEGYDLTAGTDFTIVSDTNGTAVDNGNGTATFTPDTDYVGNAGFVFSFLDAGNVITKNACINVLAGTTDINPFYFIDVIGANLSTLLVSNTILINGNNIPVPLSITGGEYSKNGGTFTNVAGTVISGDSVTVRQTSSASNVTTTSANLTVGAYSDSFDVTTKSAVPVTVHYSLSRDISPYVDGNVGLQRNGGSSELITFVGTGDSALGFTVGDVLTANAFHYHLATRWPDDASLTIRIREGDITGTIIQTFTGGTVSLADVVSLSQPLSLTEYTVQVTTNSADASLIVLGYDLINNTAVADGLILVSAVDTTTSLIMLGQAPSQVPVPVTGTPRSGSYNMKSDANNQMVRIENTSSVTITTTLTTVPAGGSFTDVHAILAGNYLDLLLEKVGITLTVD